MTDERLRGPVADEAALIDADWAALADDEGASPPAGLDPDLAALSRRLHHDARGAEPAPAARLRLDRRVEEMTAPAERPHGASPRRRFPRWRLALPAAAALLAAVALGAVLFTRGADEVSADEVLRAAAAAATSPASGGIQTIVLETTTEEQVLPQYQASVGGVRQQSETHYWYGGPDTERYETDTSVLRDDGSVASAYSSQTVRADGTVWAYRGPTGIVNINQDDGSWRMLSTVLAGSAETPGEVSIDEISESLSVTGRSPCFTASVEGTSTVVDRDVYVLHLRQIGCFSNSIPGEIQEGLQVWYVDRETSLVLGRDRTLADGSLYSRMRATSIAYNVPVDPQVFTFEPPEGATVFDSRPLPAPTAEEFTAQLQALATQVDFPLFVPTTLPEGLVPRAVRYPAVPAPEGGVVLEYVPADQVETDDLATGRGFTVTQLRATYDLLAGWTERAEPVALEGASRAWVRDAGDTATNSAVLLLRDGTLVQVSAFHLDVDALELIAASLEPVAGSRAPLPAPTPPTIEEARAAAGFPIFVPTRVPEGLTASPPVGGRIDYRDAEGVVQLSVLSGEEGCCLAANPRQAGETVQIAGAIEARLIEMGPEYGGPILWWQQDGTYIAVSGPELTPEDLVEIAESVSPTADPGPLQPPPGLE